MTEAGSSPLGVSRLPRPRSLDPAELGFIPQRPASPLAAASLLHTLLGRSATGVFGRSIDNRNLQDALLADFHDQSATDEEIWLDYVAGAGDGFNSTYQVAYALAQPALDVAGQVLPRGDVLVMGGGQVSSVASPGGYEHKCKGPYRAAMPEPPALGRRPTVFALPGAADWSDGLTTFLRLFARRTGGHVGGWQIQQRRSCFAVRLPAGWWLWGVDPGPERRLDDPQLLYFEQAAGQVRASDRIMLCTPAPDWVGPDWRPDGYDWIDYFLRTIVAPTKARVPIIVAGGLHHYARYTGAGRELITCGGGGAGLDGTHFLPETVEVPSDASLARHNSPSRRYDLATRSPDGVTSRRYAWRILSRLPLRNPSFVVLLGMAQTLAMLGLSPGLTGGSNRAYDAITLAVISTVLAVCVWSTRQRRGRGVVLGLAHGIAQLGLAIAGGLLWPLTVLATAPVLVWLVYLPVAGVASALLCAIYLLVAASFGVNARELFTVQAIEDAKSFLRLHIGRDGTLTVYPIAVNRVSRRWRADPQGAAGASWLVPEDPVRLGLIEPPLVVR